MKAINYNPDVYFYIIIDSNWLMNLSESTFICPKTKIYSNLYSLLTEWDLFSYLLYPVEIIIPKQVKKEIEKLHKEKIDISKTANAKRHYVSLQRYYGASVKRCVRVPRRIIDYGGGADFISKADLLTLSEVDLINVPAVAIRESQLGPDSDVDKGIISLAHEICHLNNMNHCFIASYDTGIQAEVSNLFYREGMKIGCPSFIDEWNTLLDQSAIKLKKKLRS